MVGWAVLQWLGGWYCSGWMDGIAVVGWVVLQWLGGQYYSGCVAAMVMWVVLQ